jgi:hypothetical protein
LIATLDKTFDKFVAKKVRCSLKKCKLFAKKVRWVGKIISEDGVSPDPEKTQILLDMSRPETAADLMQFVCAMNWLRSSLPDYTRVMAPLSNLLERLLASTPKRNKNNAKRLKLDDSVWLLEHDTAFAACKEMLSNACMYASVPRSQERILPVH